MRSIFFARMGARNEWLERGSVLALALILIGVGWRDLGSYRREQQRGRAFEPTFVDFIRAGDAAEDLKGSSFLRSSRSRILVEGLDEAERDNSGAHFRHGLGPATRLTVVSDFAAAQLAFRLFNPIEGQDITVRLNDEILEVLRAQPVGEISRSYALAFRPGDSNVVRIEYARYNHHGATIAAGDSRKIGATFWLLNLRFR